jgi:hypothetical protein
VVNDPVNYIDITGLQKLEIINDLIVIINDSKTSYQTVKGGKNLIDFYTNIQPNELTRYQIQLDKARAYMNTYGIYGYGEIIKIYENIKNSLELERSNDRNSCPNNNNNNSNNYKRIYKDTTGDWYLRGVEEWKKWSGEERP